MAVLELLKGSPSVPLWAVLLQPFAPRNLPSAGFVRVLFSVLRGVTLFLRCCHCMLLTVDRYLACFQFKDIGNRVNVSPLLLSLLLATLLGIK